MPGFLHLLLPALPILLAPLAAVQSREPITVADASLAATFYSDSSCLLTIDNHTRIGKTVIDANVDSGESRMLIHCDTEDGRRLTLLARGDSLNVSQRADLLTREEIEEGQQGMIAWLTRSGVLYTDDSVPRRYVIGGSVFLRKSPPMPVNGHAPHSQRHDFGRIVGLLEPLLKADNAPNTNSLPTIVDPESSPPSGGVGTDPPPLEPADDEPGEDVTDRPSNDAAGE